MARAIHIELWRSPCRARAGALGANWPSLGSRYWPSPSKSCWPPTCGTCSAAGSGVKRRIDLSAQQHEQGFLDKCASSRPVPPPWPASPATNALTVQRPIAHKATTSRAACHLRSAHSRDHLRTPFPPTQRPCASMNNTQSAFEGPVPILYARQGGPERALPSSGPDQTGRFPERTRPDNVPRGPRCQRSVGNVSLGDVPAWRSPSRPKTVSRKTRTEARAGQKGCRRGVWNHYTANDQLSGLAS